MLDQELDQPATRRDLLALETATRGDLLAHQEATRGDLRAHEESMRGALLAQEEATRRDLRAHEEAMRGALLAQEEATRRDLLEHKEATRGDLLAIEARVDKRFDQIDGRMEDLRRHFDMVAENFDTKFSHLFDWTQATTSTLGGRLDRLEQDHQTRVGSVELPVTQLEQQLKPR